ncbi:protease modulator HflC [Alcaligenes ammonioxydans]|jgi:membrane protease subunit HflC|uniref:Protein HflC n=1 Tax=Alcaligenes ammonioxydans TaxID=2582914 RepID=A0ABX8SX27_9BURK|nr:protease modulator HflC [Alcaligenes ammonioxydans]EJC65314.1 HflC protein [Alcaligenes faecalis subsp. faecalis NCIB 8687]QBH18292.1 protease modulator HflC [Alcaligenes faecalis]MCH1878164.1 protease modulator HflC [Alcaligenes ammonioxydans]QXX79448.1 protease modulator HflC [Alcaligenes ammonioxydans]WGQ34372.1 protease modulator HflC [Alcaligenes faecalis]
MQRLFPALVALAVIVGLLLSSVFIVRERDAALVFALGEVRTTITSPGLYFKLPPPFENVVFLDKRLQTIETKDPERIQTSEKKNLLIDSYVKWRISDPRLFYVTFGATDRGAVERLQAQIRDALNAAVNVRTVKEVVSTERDAIMREVLTSVEARARPLGVEVVDVRLRRIDFAPEISESVYRRMEAERTQEANRLRATGAAEGERIRAEADRQREELLADAYAKAQAVRGQGDGEAAAIYSETYGKNPEFYRFYRSLEAYRSAFSQQSDTLVISPDSDFFKYWGKQGSAAAPAN